MFLLRLEAIAAVDEPLIASRRHGRSGCWRLEPDGQPAAPDRWAEDRQYLRNDAAEALATFRRLP